MQSVGSAAFAGPGCPLILSRKTLDLNSSHRFRIIRHKSRAKAALAAAKVLEQSSEVRGKARLHVQHGEERRTHQRKAAKRRDDLLPSLRTFAQKASHHCRTCGRTEYGRFGLLAVVAGARHRFGELLWGSEAVIGEVMESFFARHRPISVSAKPCWRQLNRV